MRQEINTKFERSKNGIHSFSVCKIYVCVTNTWVCLYFQNSTESHFGKQHIGSNSSKMNVLSKQLHPGSIYLFTLTVHKAGRQPASVNQTVSITHNLTTILIFSPLLYQQYQSFIKLCLISLANNWRLGQLWKNLPYL